ncbi:hypothetical protein J3R83DRAFT_6185 [Lanmaoa asiatica]|nr:hypothetical protein J3R83DRAFT_6185 [Lanmaoa asiatica]
MDPCSFNIDTARELRLRRHIREVLLPYARTHLTSDHVAFTEKVVEELLLQTLEYVPMADATSFLLPIEPFEVLMGSLHSLDLTPPEEKWATPLEHVEYLRTFFPPPSHPRDLRTEKCWNEDDYYAKLSLIRRPISSPILSKRARRETPKLGSTNSRAFIPRIHPALTAFLDLKPVSVQSIEDLPTTPVDDVLCGIPPSINVSRGVDGWTTSFCRDLRLKLDSANAARVRLFLQSVLVPSMREKSVNCFDDTPNVPEFLNHDSPPRRPPSLDSPPLFPRIARGRSAHRGVRNSAKSDVSHPIRVSDLASMLQAASPQLIDSEDGDVNNHHMEVVNGWTTLTFSSPPPPSLRSSDGSEADEVWNISPPGTPATSLMVAKMDEVEIPRIRKFGHKNTLVYESVNDNGTADLLTVAKSPGFFITSFISASIPMTQTHKSITSQLEGVESGMHSPRPLSPGQSTSNSLLGQPPSAPEEQANEQTSASPTDCVEDFEEQRLDDALASIYVSTPQDPLSYIREEKLDDKDIMLMDVPNMPPPTAHPKEPTLFPKGMQSLVALKGELGCLDTANYGSNGFGPTAFLRPVKGIKPLALDLSWRPFNFGKTVPTDEEVAGIAKPIQLEDEVPGYRDEKYEKKTCVLLDLSTPLISAEDIQPTSIPKIPRGCEEFGTSPAPKRTEEIGHVEYLLTQRERMRASCAKITLEAGAEVQGDLDIEQGIAPWFRNHEHGDILAQDEDFRQREGHQGSRNPLESVEYSPRNRTEHGYSFDDSGIDIIDNNLGQCSTSEFGVPLLLLHPLQDDLLYAVDTHEANKENVDNQSENKENIPPRDVDDYQAEYQPDPLANQYDWSSYFEFPESGTSSFEPLSFASQSQLLGPSDNFTNSKAQDVPPLTPSAWGVKHPEDGLVSTSECEQTNSRVAKRRKLDDLIPASSKDLFSTFIGLRNQAVWSRTLEHSETRNDTPTPHQTSGVTEQILPRTAPDDVFDQHTVRLPEHWIPAAAVHRYLASMTLIQKRALVRELQGHHCRVVLVERYDLGGTDIIIDPDYGVLFIPLLALPAHLESAVQRISLESWRYLNILIVLEAFPSAQSFRADRSQDTKPVPYAYTPPICKAIKKLRRNLGIAEGCGTMNSRCAVTWAFANDIEEAAKFVRCFGEEACAISTERGHRILWNQREWLEEEEREGESDLSRVHGMNAFAAFVMLYDRSLEAILDLSPEARLADFGQLLGQERMVRRPLSLFPIDPSSMMQTGLNAVIESRMQQITPDIAESVVDPGY